MLEKPSAYDVVPSRDISNHHNSSMVTTLIDRYTYTVNGSKNHRGGFGTIHDSNKVVTAYPTLVGNSSDPL